MFDVNKYKYYSDDENKVVAVSTYAGRTVRGVAKCDPRDEFDLEKGKMLAAARCSVRVAKKRNERATKEFQKAISDLGKASARVEAMRQYVEDSYAELIGELNNLDTIFTEM